METPEVQLKDRHGNRASFLVNAAAWDQMVLMDDYIDEDQDDSREEKQAYKSRDQSLEESLDELSQQQQQRQQMDQQRRNHREMADALAPITVEQQIEELLLASTASRDTEDFATPLSILSIAQRSKYRAQAQSMTKTIVSPENRGNRSSPQSTQSSKNKKSLSKKKTGGVSPRMSPVSRSPPTKLSPAIKVSEGGKLTRRRLPVDAEDEMRRKHDEECKHDGVVGSELAVAVAENKLALGDGLTVYSSPRSQNKYRSCLRKPARNAPEVFAFLKRNSKEYFDYVHPIERARSAKKREAVGKNRDWSKVQSSIAQPVWNSTQIVKPTPSSAVSSLVVSANHVSKKNEDSHAVVPMGHAPAGQYRQCGGGGLVPVTDGVKNMTYDLGVEQLYSVSQQQLLQRYHNAHPLPFVTATKKAAISREEEDIVPSYQLDEIGSSVNAVAAATDVKFALSPANPPSSQAHNKKAVLKHTRQFEDGIFKPKPDRSDRLYKEDGIRMSDDTVVPAVVQRMLSERQHLSSLVPQQQQEYWQEPMTFFDQLGGVRSKLTSNIVHNAAYRSKSPEQVLLRGPGKLTHDKGTNHVLDSLGEPRLCLSPTRRNLVHIHGSAEKTAALSHHRNVTNPARLVLYPEHNDAHTQQLLLKEQKESKALKAALAMQHTQENALTHEQEGFDKTTIKHQQQPLFHHHHQHNNRTQQQPQTVGWENLHPVISDAAAAHHAAAVHTAVHVAVVQEASQQILRGKRAEEEKKHEDVHEQLDDIETNNSWSTRAVNGIENYDRYTNSNNNRDNNNNNKNNKAGEEAYSRYKSDVTTAFQSPNGPWTPASAASAVLNAHPSLKSWSSPASVPSSSPSQPSPSAHQSPSAVRDYVPSQLNNNNPAFRHNGKGCSPI